MTLVRAIPMLLFAAAAAGEEPSCPEGYIPKPAKEEGAPVECVFVGMVRAGGTATFGGETPAGWDSYLVAARARLDELAGRLPDYLCEQVTDRYRAGSRRSPKWKRKDRITAELVWTNGKEGYRDLRRNGKPLHAGTPMASGMWATGDYVTMILDLFDPATDAQFTFVREEKLNGREARMYDFAVEEKNSNWKIMFSGTPIYPAYSGTVWIDDETLNVLRAEYAATGLPLYYPEDNVEVAIDFEPVNLGGDEHLLAAKSEVIGCERGKDDCTRNVTAFSNYRMFQVESTVMQTDSAITFEGEKKP